MLARFFIDRPIAAWVISIVIVFAGLVAGLVLPVAQYPEIAPPVVNVTCNYAGADASVVAETVAAPIEQQVNGVENMLYMSSQSTNDGTYSLDVTFKLGVNLDIAQVLVQNRVSLAMPKLPDLVKNTGVNVKKKSPSILLVVNLFSDTNPKTGRPYYDQLYLSNYATIQVKDALARLEGVGDVTLLGQQDYSMRVWVDPEKLASRNLSAGDVVKVLQEQNVQVAAGQIGQPPVPRGQDFQYTMTALGRLKDTEQFAAIIIKAGKDGQVTYLRDIVRDDAFRVTLDPARLAQHGVSQEAVVESLRASNYQANADRGLAVVVLNTRRKLTQDRVEKIPIKVPGGKDVPLNALARDVTEELGVALGAQNMNTACRLDGKPSVGLAIYQLPGSNAIDTANRVKAKMKELQERFPRNLEYAIVYDTTPFVKESIHEVFKTLYEAIILVAIVVLLFLQDWKSVMLPLIDVIVSLVGTLAVMAMMGFSLNNISMFGLVLAIGIVVDDAIVVLENIERWLEKGYPVREATIHAMEEITGPIIAITLVLSSVFLPTLLIPGITGQFYKQFALTISVSMIISAINAMTLTPARAAAIFGHRKHGEHGTEGHEALPWWIFGVLGGMASLAFLPAVLGHGSGAEHGEHAEGFAATLQALKTNTLLFLPGALVGGVVGWFIIKPVNAFLGQFFRGFNVLFKKATDGYGRIVGWSLRLCVVVLLVYGGLLALTGFSFTQVPTGFIPSQDKGYLVVNIQLPDSSSLERTVDVTARVEEIARAEDAVAHTLSIPGQSVVLNAISSNYGSMFIILKPFHDRTGAAGYADAVAARIRKRCFEDIEEAGVAIFGAPAVDGLGNAGGFKLMVQDRGSAGPAMLEGQADNLAEKANEKRGLVGVFSSFRDNTPQLFADIDRVKCKTLGLDLSDVFNTLQVFLGGYYTNDFNFEGRTWQVNVQAAPSFRVDPDAVRELKVRSANGDMVPLGTVIKVRDSAGPVMVTRYNTYPAAPINGASRPGVSTGTVIEEMEGLARDQLPRSMAVEWTELTFMQKAVNPLTTLFAFVGAVALVYLVLAFKYESWSLPTTVILVVPMCLLCAVAGVAVAGMDINIFVQVGFIVLVGLACKNAILVVEFAKELQTGGRSRFDATVEAGRERLRPIIMTSLAFVLGVVPLVIARGAGAEMRRTLGTAVFAGMLGVTFFGIFLTPVFYFVISRLTETGKPPAPAAPPSPRADGQVPTETVTAAKPVESSS